jgi:DNA processing protein
MARACGEAAARAGVAVVSGLARGVDSCALEATMDAGGWPLGVLGCGIDVVYPPENKEVQEAVARCGTLISEFPLGTRPTRYSFPRRNRVIAALCRQLLVVEAGRKSGALITARYALELGREVWVVPGAVDSPQSVGSNELLYDGAQPVIDPTRLPEMLGIYAHSPGKPAETEPLLITLGRRALTHDEIAEELQLTAHNVRSRLIALELEGRVTCSAGGRYLRT